MPKFNSKIFILIIFTFVISCDKNTAQTNKTEKRNSEITTKRKKENTNINDIKFIQDKNVKIGKINDIDGYSNLRNEKNNKSKIICRINENEIFFYKPNVNNWFLVKDLMGNIGYIHKSRIKEINTDNYFSIKTFLPSEKDTIIETHSIINFYEFKLNAKEFNGNQNSNDNIITFNLNNDFKILIEKAEFDEKLHKIEFNKKSKYIIETIDNEVVYGAEQLPEYEVSAIKLIQNTPLKRIIELKIPNLFNPNFRDSRIYKTNDNRIIIWLELGENSSAMSMIIIVKNNKIIDKIKYIW